MGNVPQPIGIQTGMERRNAACSTSAKYQPNMPRCDHRIAKDNRKTQAQFECVNCKYKNHADVVGAMNILERGHRLLARGEMVHLGRSMKQEPTEVSQLVFN